MLRFCSARCRYDSTEWKVVEEDEENCGGGFGCVLFLQVLLPSICLLCWQFEILNTGTLCCCEDKRSCSGEFNCLRTPYCRGLIELSCLHKAIMLQLCCGIKMLLQKCGHFSFSWRVNRNID